MIYIDRAITICTEGDGLIDQLVVEGDGLHELIESGTASPAEIDAIVVEVGALNEELTVLEDRFSAVLGEGARWIRDLLFVVASAATALVLAIAGTVFIWFERGTSRLTPLQLRSTTGSKPAQLSTGNAGYRG